MTMRPNLNAAQRKEQMGYTRNSPRCANCTHFASTLYPVQPKPQPECVLGGFRVHLWGKCIEWTRRVE